MDIKKLNPWDWYKKEDESENRDIAVSRRDSQAMNRERYSNNPLLSLHQDINRMFDNVFQNLGFSSFGSNVMSSLGGENFFRPNVDIQSSDRKYSLQIEAPGVEDKDIKLELANDNTLVIWGEKKQERNEEQQDYYHRECAYGSFERVLSLPEDADQDHISAHFKNGILTVDIPRKNLGKSKARQIEINKDDNMDESHSISDNTNAPGSDQSTER